MESGKIKGYEIARILALGMVKDYTCVEMYYNDQRVEFEDGIMVYQNSLWAEKDCDKYEIGNSILTDDEVYFTFIN